MAFGSRWVGSNWARPERMLGLGLDPYFRPNAVGGCNYPFTLPSFAEMSLLEAYPNTANELQNFVAIGGELYPSRRRVNPT